MFEKLILTITICVVVLLLTACSEQMEYCREAAEYYAPEEEPPVDLPPPICAATYEPEITVPIQLTVDSIPYGVEPADFVRDLGYASFAEDVFLRAGVEWLVLRTNVAIRDFRFIFVTPWYDVSFDSGWQIDRNYAYEETRHTTDLLPDEPFVMAWQAERGLTEIGLEGVAFIDTDGHKRYFIMRPYGEAVHLVEFENTVNWRNYPRISVINPSPEIELVVAWISARSLDEAQEGQEDCAIFLQQFESYTEFVIPYLSWPSWVAFSANIDLFDFVFFRLGQICDPWVDDEWHPFYVGTALGHQELLPFGTPLVVDWHPVGTMPGFGFGFYDENGTRRNFALHSNEGSGFPPMFMFEFVDRGACGGCEWCE